MSSRPLVYLHRLEWVPAEWYMDANAYALLDSFADVCDDSAYPAPLSQAELVERMRGATAILSLNGSHAEEITTAVLNEVGTVKVAAVSHWWGSSSENAGKAWSAAGVHVNDASDACNQSVAEWALGALIAGLRKFDYYDREMKNGALFPTWRGMAGQLNGSTVGLVGVGRVGRWLVRYLQPFDVRVLVYDPFMTAATATSLNVELVDLPTLLHSADAISLHAPVIPETKGMLGADELAMIRDGALFINSARAWLYDSDALKKELKSGRIRAYIDVFEPEPPELDDVLRTLDNVVLTPHIAGTTDLMFHRCAKIAITAIRDDLQQR